MFHSRSGTVTRNAAGFTRIHAMLLARSTLFTFKTGEGVDSPRLEWSVCVCVTDRKRLMLVAKLLSSGAQPDSLPGQWSAALVVASSFQHGASALWQSSV